MNIKPLSDRVLIKRLNPVEKSAGGLFVPVNAQSKSNQGVVVSTGPGFKTDSGKLVEMTVKVGDHVAVAKHGGQDIKLGGEEFLLVRETEIMYIVDHPEDQ